MREDSTHMPTAESLVSPGQQFCCLKSQGPNVFSFLFYYGVYMQMLHSLTMSRRPLIPSMRIYGSPVLFVFLHKETALSPFSRITRHWFLSRSRLTRNFLFFIFHFLFFLISFSLRTIISPH